VPLAPASQGVHPLPLDFVANPAELVTAMVQGEVLVEAAQHHREVLLLLASLPMPVPQQPLAGASEELTATLGAGNADQGKAPCPIHPTGVFEAKKLERLRPLSVLAPRGGGKTPKEQQPSLVLGQLQIEARKTLPQMVLEVLRIAPKQGAAALAGPPYQPEESPHQQHRRRNQGDRKDNLDSDSQAGVVSPRDDCCQVVVEFGHGGVLARYVLKPAGRGCRRAARTCPQETWLRRPELGSPRN
jgi:hypothetical protein